MGAFSIWHVLVVLIVCLFFFGPRRLPELGQSLGEAIKGFKSGLREAENDEDEEREALPAGTGKTKKPRKKSTTTQS